MLSATAIEDSETPAKSTTPDSFNVETILRAADTVTVREGVVAREAERIRIIDG